MGIFFVLQSLQNDSPRMYSKMSPALNPIKMKSYFVVFFVVVILSSCSVKKNLETSAPFKLGEPFGQKWLVEDNPKKEGYDVIIPILSLDEDDAVLHNLYHRSEMTSIEIEMREIGMVAVAEFPSIENSEKLELQDEEPFPFLLGEAEAVLSYLHNDKVRYIKINGIRQNPTVAFPSLLAKRSN